MFNPHLGICFLEGPGLDILFALLDPLSPILSALCPGRLPLGNQGLPYPQASGWVQPIGALAEGGGAGRRVRLGSLFPQLPPCQVTVGWL